jgi:hypothetical protein
MHPHLGFSWILIPALTARLVLMVVVVDSTVVQDLHCRASDVVIGPYLNPIRLLQLSDSLVALEVFALVVISPYY